MKRVAAKLVRTEVVVTRHGDHCLERIGPIRITAGDNLERIRQQLLTLKDIGPKEHYAVSEIDLIAFTLVTDYAYQYCANSVSGRLTFFDDRAASGSLDYEFERFIEVLANDYAAAHPEDVVKSK